MDNQSIPAWICRPVRDIAVLTAISSTIPTLRENTALSALDTIKDVHIIKNMICRLVRDIAALTAVDLTYPTLRECTVLPAPDIITDVQRIRT